MKVEKNKNTNSDKAGLSFVMRLSAQLNSTHLETQLKIYDEE